MKRVIVVLLFFFIITSAFSQSRINGDIYDKESNELLSGISVFVYDNGVVEDYAFSNEKGHFSINIKNLKSHSNYLLFSLIGYKQQMIYINTIENNYIKVLLELQPININAVTVKPKPIVINKDTISYDADAFKKRSDLTLAQVIERIPGITVTSSGGISVDGLMINKFYIEEMDLLGSRYAMAMNNLRAEDISKIEIYKNHQPVKVLSNRENSKQSAINIKLKQKAKARWLFSYDLAAGDTPILYKSNLNAMRFAKSKQSVYIAKVNNCGENIVRETRMQALKPGVYLMSDLENSGDLFQIFSNYLPIPEQSYYFNKSVIASANNVYKTKNDLTVRSNVGFIFNNLKTDRSYMKFACLENGDTVTISDANHYNKNERSVYGDVNLLLNSQERYLEDDISFNANWSDARRYTYFSGGDYLHKYDLPSFNISNKLNMMIPGKNKNKIVRFASVVNAKRASQHLNVQSSGLIPLLDTLSAGQTIMLESINADNSMAFYKVFKNLSLSGNIGFIVDLSKTTSTLAPALKSYSSENDISLANIKPYIKLKFDYSYKNLKINGGLPFTYRYDIANVNKYDNKSYIIANPYINFDYSITSDLSLLCNYLYSNNVSGIKEMREGYIMNNVNSLSSYTNLTKTSLNECGLYLTYKNIIKMFSAKIFGTFNVQENNLMPSDIIIDNILLTQFVSDKNLSKGYSIGASINKYFLDFPIENVFYDVTFAKSLQSQMLQNQSFKYNSGTLFMNAGLSVSPWKFLDIDYKFSYTNTRFHSVNNQVLKSYNHALLLNLYINDKITINSDYNKTVQRSANGFTESINLDFLNFKFSYAVSKKITVTGQVNNITDNKRYVNRGYLGVYTSEYYVNLRGREFLAGVSYKL